MGIKVNTDAIRRLRSIAKNLRGTEKFLNMEAQLLLKLVNKAFTSSTDPNGKKWEKLKSRRVKGRKPLLETGNLQWSVGASVEGKGINLSVTAPYGSYHVHGTSKMPARNFLPVKVLGLGSYEQSDSGPAGFHWLQLKDRLALFILEDGMSRSSRNGRR